MSIKIAIIDDGVNENYYNNIGKLSDNIEITTDLKIKKRNEYNSYVSSHGTVCAAIIKKYVPKTSLSSIKILNDDCKGIQQQLILALNLCIELKISIINLSLGTIHYADFNKIKRVINYISQKGIIIIAACNNKDIFTYPASHSSVIGVKCDKKGILKETQFIYHINPTDGIDVTASGIHYLIDFKNEGCYTINSNSYAAPYITSVVFNIITDRLSNDDALLKDKLKGKAINYKKIYYYKNVFSRRVDWIEKAIIFRIINNEENRLHAFDSFIVKKEIVINSLSQKLSYNEIFNKIDNDNDLINNIDTIIIIFDHSANLKIEEEKNLLIKFFDYHKHIIFITYHNYKLTRHISRYSINKKIWHPSFLQDIPLTDNKGELKIPLIVIKYEKDQILFDFLLKLQNMFRNDGYYAFSCSDCCEGILSDIEYIKIKSISTFYQELKNFEKIFSPDILIVGINNNYHDSFLLKEMDNKIKSDILINIQYDSNKNYLIFINSEDNNPVKFLYANNDDFIKIYQFIIQSFN